MAVGLGWPFSPSLNTVILVITVGTFKLFYITVEWARTRGDVAFVDKPIVQAGGKDGGGNVALQLRVDGAAVGSVGVQQLAPPSTVSAPRTISASYVSGGAARG